MRAGGTTINSVLTFVGIPALPFGGVGDSGFGRFHGDDGLREFTRPKATTRKKFNMGKDMKSFPRDPEAYKIVSKVLRLKFSRRSADPVQPRVPRMAIGHGQQHDR